MAKEPKSAKSIKVFPFILWMASFIVSLSIYDSMEPGSNGGRMVSAMISAGIFGFFAIGTTIVLIIELFSKIKILSLNE